jgi:uncharacterized protein YndB with AHSA1/START domain
MEHRLRTVGLEFLESAPHRFVFEADIAAPRAEVFAAISADPSTWMWFPGLDEGRYEGPGPHGVGSIREVRMGDARYRETILVWDEPSRWAYRVDETVDSLIDALVEDWVIEGDGDRSTVRWTFAVEPGPEFEAAISTAEAMIGDAFRQAMANLSAQLSGARG